MHLVVRAPALAQSAPGHAERPHPQRGPRRRPQDLPPEGHRQCTSPCQPRSAVHVTAASSLRPSPATMSINVPKKIRRLAIKSAHDLQAATPARSSWWTKSSLAEPKTKLMAEVLGNLATSQGWTMLVTARPRRRPSCAPPATSWQAYRPLTSTPSTCYDILKATARSSSPRMLVKGVEEVYANEKSP